MNVTLFDGVGVGVGVGWRSYLVGGTLLYVARGTSTCWGYEMDG